VERWALFPWKLLRVDREQRLHRHREHACVGQDGCVPDNARGPGVLSVVPQLLIDGVLESRVIPKSTSLAHIFIIEN
jgi:hypothetical protein